MIEYDKPIVLGLAGGMGSGKTATANAFAPPAQVFTSEDKNNIIWTKLSFADPIKRMATARQKIKGDNAWSRQCYEIHEVVSELFRFKLLYDEVVDLVYEVMNIPVEPESEKPRSFMQYVGTDLFRSIDPGVWVRYMKYAILREYNLMRKENQDQLIGVVVDDCRFINECEFFRSQPQGILIRFNVSLDIAQERLLLRDRKQATLAELNHQSELDLKSISSDYFDAIINTDGLDLKEQVLRTRNIVNNILGLEREMYSALK